MGRQATPPAIPAPTHLTPAAGEFWTNIQTLYGISDAAGLRLLTLAAESLHEAERARLAIVTHGQIYTDRFGAPRPRPEVAIQRNAMLTFSRLVKELRLDPVHAEASTNGKR